MCDDIANHFLIHFKKRLEHESIKITTCDLEHYTSRKIHVMFENYLQDRTKIVDAVLKDIVLHVKYTGSYRIIHNINVKYTIDDNNGKSVMIFIYSYTC